MKALVHNGIESIPEALGQGHLPLAMSLSSDQSAAVKSTFGSTASASPVARTMGRKRYVGPIAHLHGKTALVEPRVGAADQVMVQFEEPRLREARGWWQFSGTDFETLGSLRNG